MAYTKNTWANGDVITKAKLDHIENGIFDNAVTQVAVNNGVASFKNADNTELFTLNLPSSYILLGSDEVTVNTTNTSATNVLTMNLTASDLWTSAKIIYVSVRGKSGKRQGYFYGSDCWFINPNPANNSATTSMTGTRMAWYTYDANGLWSVEIGSTWYGVFAYDITNEGRLRIRCRYNATSTLTINDTFEVKAYALAWADGSPFA